MTKGIKGVLIFTTVVALMVIYKVFNPYYAQYFPKCPFKLLTGYQCPGCGSQRAIHDLLNLDIVHACKENMLVVVSIPYLLAGFTFDHIRRPGARLLKLRKTLFGRKAIFLILAIILFFWIGRNL